MKTLALSLFAIAAIAVLALGSTRPLDARADRREWLRLAARQPDRPLRFDPIMVADLPDPARRFFTFSITRDTPLLTVAEITMAGRFGLGTKDTPRYQAMQAQQILAVPQGFVWTMRTRSGLPLSGSDAAHWSRFRILGMIPVARLGGTTDHTRSAFGRQVAEALFWTPAALLPGPGVAWQAIDGDTARVTLTHGELVQSVDLRVNAEGRPLQVAFQRWSDANIDRTYRLQPFGGYLSDFREVQGFRIPFHVEAGNLFGTSDYFPFFVVDLTDARFRSR